MILQKALKFRIYPNAEQKQMIDQTIGCCRFVYNSMLSRNTKMFKRRGAHLSRYDMQNCVVDMKQYLPWLMEADSQALQYACKQLDDAFKNFFRKQAGYPNFKRKHAGYQSYTNPHGERVAYETGRVKIPKLGWVEHHDTRTLNGSINSVTISRTPTGKYYASISYDYEAEFPPRSFTKEETVGLDFKVASLYADSEGNSADMPKYYKNSMKRLARAQRKLKHKKTKSKNYYKQQKKVARIHEHVANQRRDFLQKQSTAIAKRYGCVCIEDLRVRDVLDHRNMRKYHRSVLDNGWYSFTQMLQYKMSAEGGVLIKADKDFSSTQRCHSCGYINSELSDDSIRSWTCPQCGLGHGRDINAAINLKNYAISKMHIA